MSRALENIKYIVENFVKNNYSYYIDFDLRMKFFLNVENYQNWSQKMNKEMNLLIYIKLNKILNYQLKMLKMKKIYEI